MLEAALISAGANLIGGLMGQSAQSKAADAQREMAERNIALQKEFAQSGIQWKVADAKAAGIHPLYALGANTTSFSPVSVGSPSGSPLGDAISRSGQDLSRAVAAGSNSITRAATALSLENQGLQNELLRSQIRKLNAQVAPPIPTANDPWNIPGQSGSGISFNDVTKPEALKYTPVMPDAPHAEPAPNPHIGYVRTPTGWMPVPGKEAKDRMEDMGLSPWIWSAINQVAPNFGLNHQPPPHVKLAPDEDWYYHPYQEYRIRKKKFFHGG